MQYKTVILGLELSIDDDENSVLLLRKASSCVASDGTLCIAHAIEWAHSAYGMTYGALANLELEQSIVEEVRRKVSDLIRVSGIVVHNLRIEIGRAQLLVLDLAKELSSDLIVVGSHGRHGIRLLLGSTANAILHGATCDVLAVRIFEKTHSNE